MRSRLLMFTLLLMPVMARAQAVTVKTFTYKRDLQADVYDFPGRSKQPVIVFIHGGALMMGNRGLSTNSGSLLHTLVTAGYAVVSIDYRLAPQVKLPAIIEDVQDACKWVREKGPELFRINPDELFVMGQSAGGYLTLMTGFRIHPRPRALVSFWGYGDIAGAWYSRQDPFYLQQPLASKEEAEQAGGARLYLYCRQQGLWPKVLTGHDPDADPRAFDPFCPLRNVSKEYPPTLLIHGDRDTDVPYEQSVLMAKELSRHDVAHNFITLTNGGHGISRRDAALAARTYEQVVRFLDKHRKSVRMAGIVLKWIRTDKESNYRRIEPMIREAAANAAKIVCTTECFLDGYAIADKSIPLDDYRALGEAIPDGRYFQRLSALAKELKIHLIAGLTEADGDARFNTAVVLGPAGELIGKYRKQRLQHEAVRNTAGETSPVFETPYGRIGVMICADRTEAGIVRRFCAAGADLLICPSGGMFGPKSNDPIVQARSRENRTHILFVHPAQFLVTAPDGANLANTVLGDRLVIEPQEAGTEKDANRIFYFDLPFPAVAAR